MRVLSAKAGVSTPGGAGDEGHFQGRGQLMTEHYVIIRQKYDEGAVRQGRVTHTWRAGGRVLGAWKQINKGRPMRAEGGQATSLLPARARATTVEHAALSAIRPSFRGLHDGLQHV